MQKKKKISIIIPVYNVEKYLSRCLESVINQTYKNIEIIIVNDGSLDNSFKICNEYKNKDKRIILINQENQGLSGARNTGLKHVTGEYICFIDSDDYVEKDYVEYLYNLILKDDYDISACNFSKVINNDIQNTNEEKEILSLDQKQTLKLLFDTKNNFTQSSWAKLYKKELFDNIKFPLGKIYEDIETIGNILLNVNKVIYSNESKYYYYIREDSLSFGKYSIKDLDRIEHSKKLVDKVILKYPDLKSKAIEFYITNLIAVCNKQLIDKKYNTKEIKYTKKVILNNIINILKSNFSIIKKIQILLFFISVRLYLKVYLVIKKQ